MVSYRDLTAGFLKFGFDNSHPVLVHASLSKFGEIRGGADTLLGALLANFRTVVMPAFTFKTMLVPEEGPENNAVVYGSSHDNNRMTEFFSKDLEVDPLIGDLAECLRKHPQALRSNHPIFSFAGINAEKLLKIQSVESPFEPIRSMSENGGIILLLGVDHTVNTAIHLAEQMAGRKTFLRWALTPRGVVECTNYPGCSDGFEQAAPYLDDITDRLQIGEATVSAIPIKPMLEILSDLIKAEPEALLCTREFCPRCDAVRYSLKIEKD